MNHTPRITMKTSGMEAALAMAEGNPGAVSVIGKMLQEPMGFIDLCHLDDREIYGSDIWVAWKDVCNQDMPKFLETIRDRNNGLEEKVRDIQNP